MRATFWSTIDVFAKCAANAAVAAVVVVVVELLLLMLLMLSLSLPVGKFDGVSCFVFAKQNTIKFGYRDH